LIDSGEVLRSSTITKAAQSEADQPSAF